MLRIPQLLLGLLCSACASFPAHRLAELDARELQTGAPLPEISYACTVNIDSTSFANNIGWPTPATEQLFRSAFREAHRGPADNDLHLDLAFHTEARQPVFTLGLALLTIGSLGLIPTYAREDLTLQVRVEYQGKRVREYVYDDRIGTWVHLVMIPWSFSNDPVEVQRSVFENMLLHLVRDLRRDLPQLVPAK